MQGDHSPQSPWQSTAGGGAGGSGAGGGGGAGSGSGSGPGSTQSRGIIWKLRAESDAPPCEAIATWPDTVLSVVLAE